MRILLLTILFIGSFYYLSPREPELSPAIDSIKIKMGAPKRAEERALTVEKLEETPAPAEVAPVVPAEEAKDEAEATEVSAKDNEEDEKTDVQEVQWTELEEGWNNELKVVLSRLEPREGEAMHVAYMSEQESYQAELEALLNEKKQKTSPDATVEMEQLIAQLDYKHQEKLKDIFGVHYETVREHYEYFMEVPPSADSE
ncbi:MAG: hypothetical protein NDI69_14905 [Bacteriovoracaceae bacterium]|nr:hypothetical protein [Bacteriovoracaceae bacterium]